MDPQDGGLTHHFGAEDYRVDPEVDNLVRHLVERPPRLGSARRGLHRPLFVQSDTDDEEEGARRNLEDRFEDGLYKLDACEAIYLAGMRNLDAAEAILREWGYDL